MTHEQGTSGVDSILIYPGTKSHRLGRLLKDDADSAGDQIRGLTFAADISCVGRSTALLRQRKLLG